jgi:hypothetical protein
VAQTGTRREPVNLSTRLYGVNDRPPYLRVRFWVHALDRQPFSPAMKSQLQELILDFLRNDLVSGIFLEVFSCCNIYVNIYTGPFE